VDSIIAKVQAELEAGKSSEVMERILEHVLAHFGCVTGTLHAIRDDGMLHHVASKGLPPPVLAIVQRIPVGKGMAGVAAERREPVQFCNLQQDDSGVVRPGAKSTGMEGSIACPILVNGELLGTLGVAKAQEYEFTADERAQLLEIGALLGPCF
jgi:GAF domain-containing protein